MLESPFNKVSGLQACNFIKERLQRRYWGQETSTQVQGRVSFFIVKFLKTGSRLVNGDLK